MIKRRQPTEEENAWVPETPPPSNPFGRMLKWGLVFVSILLIILLAGKGVWALNRWLNPPAPAPEQQEEPAPRGSEEDVQVLISKIRHYMEVKEDEEPLVATVSDVEALRVQNPVFYKDAQNGDRLVVWSDKAVLYSLTQDQVLAVLNIQAARPPEASAGATLATERATIEVRNGSGISGAAATTAERLRAKGFVVTTVTNARVKNIYPTSLTAQISERPLPVTLQELQAFGQVAPSSSVTGEMPSTADILLIVGSDFAR